MNNLVHEDMELIYYSGLDWDQFKDSRVLITGATGMIGSYILYFFDYLNTIRPDLNIRTVGVVRNRDKVVKIIERLECSELFTYTLCDVANIDTWGDDDFDYIIHTASPASSYLYNEPINVVNANVVGTQKLLELAKYCSAKKFVFLSSGEVTGITEDKYIAEDVYGCLDPTDVRNCYGESKRMGEMLCKCYSYQYKLHAMSVRLDHTYGNTMDLETDGRVFSEFISNIVNDRDIVMKSDGSPIRTFTYLNDAVKGIFIVLLKGGSGESYNISNNDCRVSIKELAETLIGLYPEKKLKIEYVKRDTNSYMESKNPICSSLLTSKIEKLGYVCDFNLKEGFKRTIENYKEEIK